MPKYSLYAQVTISCYTEVEASSREEAIEIAKDREMATLPHTGTFGWDESSQWIVDELDGEPSQIQVSSVE